MVERAYDEPGSWEAERSHFIPTQGAQREKRKWGQAIIPQSLAPVTHFPRMTAPPLGSLTFPKQCYQLGTKC